MPQPKEAIQTAGGEPLDLPDYFSWENFCYHFQRVGYVEYFDGGIIMPMHLSENGRDYINCLEIEKSYRIKDITIKNGQADIEICEFTSPFERDSFKPSVMTFHLKYEITQCNLPYIGSILCGNNFRIEIADKEIISSKWSLGGKYVIKIDRERLAFRKGTT